MFKIFACITMFVVLVTGAVERAQADFLHDFELPTNGQATTKPKPPYTMRQVLTRYTPDAHARLKPLFVGSGLNYPPERLTLIGLKEERLLEVWAYQGGVPHLVHAYPVLDASGLPGPKRRRGDHQVPEGIYLINAFNPNSRFHLSMRLNYPNSFDRLMAERDGRTDPGSNIFIHGSDYSEGCLAMGDPAIEELFVLVADVGMDKVRVIIAPHDPRERSLFPIPRGLPEWTNDLYARIERAVADYRLPRDDTRLALLEED